MSTWDDDYPDGYECCASGSCEVCRGLQGLIRASRRADRRKQIEEGR